jgi:hypothetical protein
MPPPLCLLNFVVHCDGEKDRPLIMSKESIISFVNSAWEWRFYKNTSYELEYGYKNYV